APHTLELETWYHIRALWDGVYGGGCQLFIDGLPAGTDNLSTELINAIPAQSESSPGARTVVVKDASRFPSEGVVRVGAELFEYTRSGNSLRIRQEPSSSWRPSLGANRSTPQRPSSRPQSNRALTMRGPWNRRGSVAGSHPVGARVTLHGYALEVRRKIVEPDESERQAVGGEVVWTEGGRELVEPLPAFQFADGVYLEHVEIVDLSPGTAGAAEYLVPMANVGEYEIELEPGLEEEFDTTSYQWSATVSVGGEPVPASDYFQSRGVCVAYSSAFMLYYVKEPVPTEVLQRFAHASAQRFDLSGLSEPLMGLRIVGAYEEGTRGPIPATDFLEFKRAERESLRGKIRRLNGLGFETGSITVHTQIGPNSLLADAQVERRYPRLGVLEMRGSPPRWDTTRSNYAGQTPFGKHPDDVVEWLRYRDALDTTVGGQRVHLFVGRRQNVSRSTFRGYPSGDRQLDHLPGEPLRLVMELSEAGAGYGDYVSITSNNPDKFEPEVYRVYKVMERRDGRFFVSLFDSSLGGSRFQHRYTRSENPRLVKFPSARPPQWGSARASIFGTDSGVQLSKSGGEELIEEVGSVRRPGV
ncbi:MAG: hypothetical protein MK538_19680, partial [Planctomycetes bacterium]|nr:hypothetical protein [Planctomycetota bacterium]